MPLDTFKRRWPLNLQGKFYVDDGCLDCDLCRELAPTVFTRNELGWSYVYNQPTTQAEIDRCMEAVAGCPTDNVHDDGLEFDWNLTPSVVRREDKK